MSRCHSVLFTILVSGLMAACGGDSPRPGSGGDGPSEGGGGSSGGSAPPPSGQVIVLRGGERIAWDQPANSVQGARSYTYRLFIDGNNSSFTDVRCNDTRTGAGYECSGLLPAMSAGQHTLEIAAVSGNMQSASSTPLLVRVGSSLTAGGAAIEPDPVGAAASGPVGACISTSSVVCYQGHVVAAGLGAISELHWATENVAFFIEDGERVREIRDGALNQQPVLERESAGVRLVSLAVAPDFDRTHLVFVGWSEPTADGRESLHVTRYRELAGIFGEGATIVTNVPIPSSARAPISADDNGLLYVGVPALDLRRAAEGGSILRFDFSGAVPGTNPMSLPAVSSGFASPTGLAWDAENHQLWMAGTDPRWSASVLALPISPTGHVGSAHDPSVSVAGSSSDESSGGWPAISVSSYRSHLWLVSEPGQAYRGTIGGTAPMTMTRSPFDAIGTPNAVAEGPGGQLLVLTSDDGAAAGFTLWRLLPETPGVSSR